MTQRINLHKQPIIPLNHNVNKQKKQTQIEKTPFQEIFQSQINKHDQQLKFSAHAQKRMEQNGLEFNAEQVEKIAGAIQAVSQKGGKESLILTDKAALVVSVTNSTVITVIENERMKENVFTNIDSAVII